MLILQCNEFALDSDRSMPHALRAELIMLYKNKDKISPRLRSMFKPVAGATMQTGNVSWKKITEISEHSANMVNLASPEVRFINSDG